VPACIVPKFWLIQPLFPLLQTGVKKSTQKGFQTLIHALSLPIELRVICGAQMKLNASQLEQLMPKSTSKD